MNLVMSPMSLGRETLHLFNLGSQRRRTHLQTTLPARPRLRRLHLPPPPPRGSEAVPEAVPRLPTPASHPAGLAAGLCPLAQALSLRLSAPLCPGPALPPPRTKPRSSPRRPQRTDSLYLLPGFRHGHTRQRSCEGQEAGDAEALWEM